jgi:hypothetical protein
VKTVRRQLTRFVAHHCAERLGAELARLRAGPPHGVLYVGAHLRACHGQRALIERACATRHLAMPASTDYWINDCSGDPLLVMTGEVDAAVDEGLGRVSRGTAGGRRAAGHHVFDRGGWSPKLFTTMIKDGFDVLTYPNLAEVGPVSSASRPLRKQPRAARARVARLFERHRNVLQRVEVRDLSERAVVKLATQRKHLSDIIKMIADQAESDPLAMLGAHYARADQEERTLPHELFGR